MAKKILFVLTGLTLAFIIIIISAFAFVACENIVAEESPVTVMVTGTIYPYEFRPVNGFVIENELGFGSADGHNYTITIFTDDGETHTTVKEITKTVPGNIGFNYVIEDVPAGIYYVYCWIDMNDNSVEDEGIDQAGYYGYKGAEVVSTWQQPDAHNAYVPEIGVVVFDIFLSPLPIMEAMQ